MAKRYFIHLAYDGTLFHGWQIQPNAKSIQECLNDAFSKVLRQEIYTVGCGRTDTGVHARSFYAHFGSQVELDDLDELCYRVNRVLPREIAVFRIFPVKEDIHARFSATARTYEYLVTQTKDAFAGKRMWEFRQTLDVALMNQACEALFEFEDFKSFARTGGQTEHHLCDIMSAQWTAHENVLRFEVKANRFLRNMVRAMVGTMLDVGQKRLSIQEFKDIIAAKNRSRASTTAAAHGLYLIHIDYPEDFDTV